MFRLFVLPIVLASVVAASAQQQPSTTFEVRGRVIDAVTETPIADAAVQTFPLPPNAINSRTTRKASTDTSGAFTLTDMDAGEYRISASKVGYLGSEYGRKRANGTGIPLVRAANSTPAPITILMWRSGSIAGRVVDERGRPAVEVPVSALVVDEAAGRRIVRYGRSATTNDLGEYFISDVPTGRYIVTVPTRLDTRRVNRTVYKWNEPPPSTTAGLLLSDDSTAALTPGGERHGICR